AVRALEPQRSELLERHVGPDLAVRTVDPLLELGQERIDHPFPPDWLPVDRQLAGVPLAHPVGHRVMRTTGQLPSVTETARQIECFQDLHDLLARLQRLLPVGGCVSQPVSRSGRSTHQVDPWQARTSARADQLATSGQFCWPPTGRYMTANGQDPMAAVTLRMRPTTAEFPPAARRQRGPERRPSESDKDLPCPLFSRTRRQVGGLSGRISQPTIWPLGRRSNSCPGGGSAANLHRASNQVSTRRRTGRLWGTLEMMTVPAPTSIPSNSVSCVTRTSSPSSASRALMAASGNPRWPDVMMCSDLSPAPTRRRWSWRGRFSSSRNLKRPRSPPEACGRRDGRRTGAQPRPAPGSAGNRPGRPRSSPQPRGRRPRWRHQPASRRCTVSRTAPQGPLRFPERSPFATSPGGAVVAVPVQSTAFSSDRERTSATAIPGERHRAGGYHHGPW